MIKIKSSIHGYDMSDPQEYAEAIAEFANFCEGIVVTYAMQKDNGYDRKLLVYRNRFEVIDHGVIICKTNRYISALKSYYSIVPKN